MVVSPLGGLRAILAATRWHVGRLRGVVHRLQDDLAVANEECLDAVVGPRPRRLRGPFEEERIAFEDPRVHVEVRVGQILEHLGAPMHLRLAHRLAPVRESVDTGVGWIDDEGEKMGSTLYVEESVQIDKSHATVWDAIADYGFDIQWRNGLVEMTPDPLGPPAVRTKVHEVVRTSGRDYVADTVVTELDPGVSYRFEGAGTIGGLRAVRADGSGSGAVFTYTLELQPKGAMRLLRPVLGSMVRSGLKKDLQTLKTLLESRPSLAGDERPAAQADARS
jgi:hypothetical protein